MKKPKKMLANEKNVMALSFYVKYMYLFSFVHNPKEFGSKKLDSKTEGRGCLYQFRIDSLIGFCMIISNVYSFTSISSDQFCVVNSDK